MRRVGSELAHLHEAAVVVVDESPAWGELLAWLLRDELAVPAAALVVDNRDVSSLPEVAELVVIGVSSPGVEAMATWVQLVRARAPRCRIVVVADEVSPRLRRVLAPRGVDALVSRDDPVEVFLDTVHATLEGRGPDPRLHQPRRSNGSSRDGVGPLTTTELRVLRQLALGHDTPAIACELGVSVNTVRTHVQHLIIKLGAESRLGVLARARAIGLLDRPEREVPA